MPIIIPTAASSFAVITAVFGLLRRSIQRIQRWRPHPGRRFRHGWNFVASCAQSGEQRQRIFRRYFCRARPALAVWINGYPVSDFEDSGPSTTRASSAARKARSAAGPRSDYQSDFRICGLLPSRRPKGDTLRTLYQCFLHSSPCGSFSTSVSAPARHGHRSFAREGDLGAQFRSSAIVQDQRSLAQRGLHSASVLDTVRAIAKMACCAIRQYR